MNYENDREVVRMALCHYCGEVFEAETMHVWFDEDDYEKVHVCQTCFYEPSTDNIYRSWGLDDDNIPF